MSLRQMQCVKKTKIQCNWGTRHRSNKYNEMDLDVMVA